MHKYPQNQTCGFKWANNHNKCVHDSMRLAVVTKTMSYAVALHFVPN